MTTVLSVLTTIIAKNLLFIIHRLLSTQHYSILLSQKGIVPEISPRGASN